MKLKKTGVAVSLALLASTNVFAETTPSIPAINGQISNLAELRWLAENQSGWTQDWTLTADIDASETRTWNIGDHDANSSTPDEPMGFEPIGISGRGEQSFTGIFDGGNHTISNLYVNRKQYGMQAALFGSISGGELKNIHLKNFEIHGKNMVAAAVANLDNSKATNVHVESEGDVVSGASSFTTKITSIDGTVAGIAANGNESTIENVSVKAYIEGQRYAGGIVGNSYITTIKDAVAETVVVGSDRVGGAFGGMSESSATNVDVVADVSAKAGAFSSKLGVVAGDGYVSVYRNIEGEGKVVGGSSVGGLEGNNSESEYHDIHIKASVTANAGSAGGIAGEAFMTKASTNISFKGEVVGVNYVGGYYGRDSDSLEVNELHVDAIVTGENQVGGVIGLSYSAILNNVSVKPTSVVTGNDIVGGLLGTGYESQIKTVSVGGTVDGKSNVGGLIGKGTDVVATDVYVSTKLQTPDGAANVDSVLGSTSGDTLTRVYFDTEVNDYTDAHGSGLTTDQMKNKSTFSDWLWTNSWEQNRWSMPDGEYAHLTSGVLPVFTSPTEAEGGVEALQLDAGDAIDVQVVAIDSTPEARPVSYRLNVERVIEETDPVAVAAKEALPEPEFLSIDASGHITGYTSDKDVGSYKITVFAKIGDYENSLPPFEIVVKAVDTPEAGGKKKCGSFGWLALLVLTPIAYFRRRK